MDKKTRVIIALPGNRFSNNFLISWTKTLDVLWKKNYEVVVLNRYSSFVTFSRMQTLGLDVLRGPDQKPFDGKIDYDVWITIDSDMVFNPEDIIEIIENTNIHPVVSGLYLMADGVHFACVEDWDEKYFINNGRFKFLTPDDVNAYKEALAPSVPFMKVAYNGMGIFACKKGVIESLKYPYFHRPIQEIIDDNGVVIARDICSEDVGFCKNLIDAGHSIYVNCNVRVGHEKNFII